MKILKYFILISIIIILFSCASANKKTGTPPVTNNEQITENSNLHFREQRTDTDEQNTTPIELAEDPYLEPSDITEFIAEVTEEMPEQTEEVAEAAEVESDQTAEATEEGRPLRITQAQEQPIIREPWLGPQQPPAQAQTPQTQPRPQAQPPAQAQAPQSQPQAQTQPSAQRTQPSAQELTVQEPLAQPLEQTPDSPAEGESETESESEPYPPRYVRELPSAPPSRIDSLSQMGAVPNGAVNFSRVVRVMVGQILEIPFRGNGWVYLGELASRRGIAYNSRRTENEGMSFIFNVEEAGTFALKFFREDFTRGFIINDHVQVIASEAPATGTGWFNPAFERPRVTAEPRWPSAIEEAALQRSGGGGREQRAVNREQLTENNEQRANNREQLAGNNEQRTIIPSAASTTGTTPTTTAPPQTVTLSASTPAAVTPPASTTAANTTPPAAATTAAPQPAAAQSPDQTLTSETISPAQQENLSPVVLLQRAKENFDKQNIAEAISLLDQYMKYYPGGSDETYWMYGQLYEANSPNKNILLSLDYYRRLVNEYPQSGRLSDAKRRITYLERFYINIQ